jgi:acetyltransferase
VLGDALADRYQRVFDIIKKEKFYDAIIVILTPQAMTEVEKTAGEVIKLAASKPVIPCFLGGTKIKPAIDYSTRKDYSVFNEI